MSTCIFQNFIFYKKKKKISPPPPQKKEKHTCNIKLAPEHLLLTLENDGIYGNRNIQDKELILQIGS